MPAQLTTSEMAVYEVDAQERRANEAKSIANFVAGQPGPRNVPSGSKEGSESWHEEDTATEEDDDNSRERSEFSKHWKGVNFSPDKVKELLKQEPVSL